MDYEVITANDMDTVMAMAAHMASNTESAMTKDFAAFNKMIDTCIDNLGMTEDEAIAFVAARWQISDDVMNEFGEL